MTLKTPIYLENDTTTQNSDELRLERSYLMTQRQGIMSSGSFAVTQRAAGANMSVDVAGGSATIAGTQNTLQGMYSIINDAAVNLVVTAADATNARKDLVILRIRDSFYSGADDDAQLLVVAGTPAASPAEPDLDALGYENYLVLALIDVPASDTAITDSQITDRRTKTAALGGTIPCTSTTRPTVGLFEGLHIYETDTDRVYVYNGTGWTYMRGGTDPVSARAWLSGAFSLTVHASNPTLIVLNNESWDIGNNFATGTGRYTVAETGKLRVNCRASINGGVSTERFIGGIFVNAVEASRGTDILGNGGRTTIEAADVIDVTAGQEVDFRIHQVNGTSRSVDAGEAVCYMTIDRA